MFLPVYLALVSALVFYAILPVVGAFAVRKQWRDFRTAVAVASQTQGLDDMMPISDGDSPRWRCIQGDIEAMGGDHELWLRCDNATCVVDMRGAWVYLLTGRAGDDHIERRRWSGLPALGSGARAFIAGDVSLRNGRIVIAPAEGGSLLIVLHDGDDSHVVRRAIRAGRHLNEYWNPITQISLALGVMVMSVIVMMVFPDRTQGTMPSLITALTLTLAFAPILPLLPPGVTGFFAYRRFWRQARFCRARRDLETLDNLPDAQAWSRRARMATAASIASFAGALAVNAWLTAALLRRLL
jgi:hypothetical protein